MTPEQLVELRELAEYPEEHQYQLASATVELLDHIDSQVARIHVLEVQIDEYKRMTQEREELASGLLAEQAAHIDAQAARIEAADRVITAARNKINSDNGCLDVSSGYASDRLWEALQAYDAAREGHHAE